MFLDLRLDINKLNFFEKFIMSKVKGVKTSVYELSEEKIYAFAEKLKKTIYSQKIIAANLYKFYKLTAKQTLIHLLCLL